MGDSLILWRRVNCNYLDPFDLGWLDLSVGANVVKVTLFQQYVVHRRIGKNYQYRLLVFLFTERR